MLIIETERLRKILLLEVTKTNEMRNVEEFENFSEIVFEEVLVPTYGVPAARDERFDRSGNLGRESE